MDSSEGTIRILHLEDNPNDASLIREMITGGPDPLQVSICLVSTRDRFLAELRKNRPDLILCDYRIPGYDGVEALREAQTLRADVPVIMVTGEMGEERAVETLKLGASDYVLKDRLKRLVPSIRRTLKDAALERDQRRIGDALERSRRQMHEILESISDGLWAVDNQWCFVYHNKHAAENLGFRPEDLLGKNLWDTFPQIMNTEHERHYRKVMRERFPSHFETAGVLTPRAYAISVYPSGDGISVYWKDISERRETELRLQESEKKYRTLFENMAEEVHFWQLVRNDAGEILTWRLIDVNPPTLRTWGKRLEEIKGKTADEIFGPGATEYAMPGIRQVLSTGVPYTFEDYIPKLDKYFRFTTIPFGEYFIITGAEITAAKQAQRLAEEERAEIAAIYDNTPIGLCVFDRNLRYVRINKKLATIDGLTPDRHIGKTPREVVPDLGEKIEKVLRKILETGEPFLDFEMTGTTAAQPGVMRSWNVRLVPMRDQQRNILSVSAVVEETTERKQAEEEVRRLNESLEARVKERTAQLESANQELESFSYSVAHDLKTPVRAIESFSQQLVGPHREGLSGKQQEHLAFIRASAAQMGKLIGSLLVFSRTARQAVHPQPVDMRRLAEEVIKEQQQALGEAGEHVRVAIDELPARATGDPQLLRQVLANLIGNAFKFTQKVKVPTIEIGGYRKAEESVYFVRDNGAGFPVAHAWRLFQVFQRLHTQTEFEGTGVGLANVRKIIERHGGKVWAEGDEGKGATFFFSLPRREEITYHEGK